MNHLKILITTFFLCNFAFIFAQNGLSSTAFLAAAEQQNTVQIATQQTDFQANQDGELPWLQELEFRTETNDFLWRQQEYVVRVTPNTKRQRIAQKEYHQAITELSKTEAELVFKNALFIRYKWLVEWLEVQQKITDKLVLKVIYEDKLTIEKRKVDNLDFEVTDLVKAEEDLLEIEAEIVELQAKKERLLDAFQHLTNGKNTPQFDGNSAITIEQIRNKMRVQSLDSLNSLALERRQNRMDILDKETEIELSEINNPISYTQLKVGGNGNNFQEFVSVGFGVRLPLKGDKKLDLNELAFEKMEASGEYSILKEKLTYEQQQLIERTNQLITQKQFLQKQLKNSQAVFVLEKLLETDGSNPSDILDLKEIIIKKEQKINQIDFEILAIYVEWLAVSNKMMERPLQNHLVREVSFF
jgi:hypothetical protein